MKSHTTLCLFILAAFASPVSLQLPTTSDVIYIKKQLLASINSVVGFDLAPLVKVVENADPVSIVHIIETSYDIHKGLKALNALDLNGSKKLPSQFSDLSVEALDILSGGETSRIIEINKSIAKVQRMLGTISKKSPSSAPLILTVQGMLLNLQVLLVNAELSSSKYDYFWAAVAAYYKVMAAMNGNWGKSGWNQSGSKNVQSGQNSFAMKQISQRKLSKRKIRNSRWPMAMNISK